MNNPPSTYYCVRCCIWHRWETRCPKGGAGDDDDEMDTKGGGSGAGAVAAPAAAAAAAGAAAAGAGAAAAGTGAAGRAWRRAMQDMGQKPMQYACPHCNQMHPVGGVCPRLVQTDFKARPDGKGEAQMAFRWVFEHPLPVRQAIYADAKARGLDGLCSAWTSDWLRRRLMRQPITKATYANRSAVAEMQQWFAARVNGPLDGTGLDQAGVGAGIVAGRTPACSGLVSEFKPDSKLAKERYNHLSGAYYLAMWGTNPDTREQDRHAIGIDFRPGNWAFFDQNQGMLEVVGPVPQKLFVLNKVLSWYLDKHLTNWELFSVELGLKVQDDSAKSAVGEVVKPPLVRRRTF
ncbi:Hypothetical protein A7982_10958 [Minicystis rosea]|nr:Hypothetical protein A7982_10958 [Minicystis rosea]